MSQDYTTNIRSWSPIIHLIRAFLLLLLYFRELFTTHFIVGYIGYISTCISGQATWVRVIISTVDTQGESYGCKGDQ